MKKVPNWIIIIFVLALLIGAKFMFFGKPAGAGTKNGKGGKNNSPVSVNYCLAEKSDLSNNVYTTGKTGSINEIEIKPEISGKVTALYFKEGELITKGQAIIKINDADLQAQLQKNKVQVKLAEEKLERLKKLLSINGISQEEYDTQENEVLSLKADQALLMAQVAKTNITAPFSGIIGLKNISEGSYVSPAQSIATLVQTKPLYVEFSVPEKYSNSLKKGLKVNFSFDRDESSKTFSAQVYAIEPKIDEITRTLRGRALYSGNETIYPGSFVKVYVDLGKTTNSIMIPTESVIPILKGQKVYVCKNGVAEEVKVITGIRTDNKIQILEGLQPGDTVLTTGLMAVKKQTKLILLSQTK